MRLFVSYFHYLARSVTDVGSLVLLIAMSSSLASFVVAMTGWYLRYVKVNPTFHVWPLFGFALALFFMLFWLVPFFRIGYLDFILSSRISKFYDDVNLKFGVTKLEITLLVSFVYLTCERSPLVVAYWADLHETFIFLFFLSGFRVLIFLPISLKLGLERTIDRTPALKEKDPSRSFLWMLGNDVPGIGALLRRVVNSPGAEKVVDQVIHRNLPQIKPPIAPTLPAGLAAETGGASGAGGFNWSDAVRAGTAAVVGLGGATLAHGETRRTGYINQLAQVDSTVRGAIQTSSSPSTVGERVLADVEAQRLACECKNSLYEGAESIFNTVADLVFDTDPRTTLQISVSDTVHKGCSFATTAIKK